MKELMSKLFVNLNVLKLKREELNTYIFQHLNVNL